MGKRPTIQEVAEYAGVSRGTVDRVLNQRSYVREEVKERVLGAIQVLGYLSPRQAHQQNIEGTDLPAPLKLGVLLPNWSGTFYKEITRGIEAAQSRLASKQVEVRILRCESDLPIEAIELLEQLKDWGAEGIALCALNDVAIEARIELLKECGIPCVTFNSDLPNSSRVCFVGQDYEKSGRVAAELIYKCTARQGKVLALAGNLEYYGHSARLRGFCEHMHTLGFPTNQIIVNETYNDYRVTYNKVLAALQEMPDIIAVYMVNRSVTGCTDAIEASGRTGTIRVVAHDMSERTKSLLRLGRLDFTITQDMYQQGYQPLLVLFDLLRNKKPAHSTLLNNDIAIICAQNMDGT